MKRLPRPPTLLDKNLAAQSRVTKKPGSASILAIGTELTTGQITNRNAAWLSEKLVELGLEVVLHETVADDRPAILDALDRCESLSRFIFVTGGLGPTTDDFTREVIAEWSERELEFDPGSWEHIVRRLSGFGIKVAESNRQQCYFPKGSRVIPNPEGTACAFDLAKADCHAWILPGPPREIEAVWRAGRLAEQITQLAPPVERVRLLTWQCMGISEAELGEITERALQGSGLVTGYRAHRPYVEVKVWCKEQELADKQVFIDRLDETISRWVITRGGEDLAERMLEAVAKLRARRPEIPEVLWEDLLSQGLLAERIGGLLRELKRKDPQQLERLGTFRVDTIWSAASRTQAPTPVGAAVASARLELRLGTVSPQGECDLSLSFGGVQKRERIRSPWNRPELLERMQRFFIEMALYHASRWISEL